MKKIVVTGGAGFLGSEITKRLLVEPKTQVYIIDDLSAGGMWRFKGWKDRIKRLIVADVRDRRAWNQIGLVDGIFHFADIVGCKKATESPSQTVTTAIEGAAAVAEAAGISNCPLFYASTSMVYGPNAGETAEESWPRFGTHPVWAYAAGKLCGEFIVTDIAKKKGFPVLIGRLFNIVGPTQNLTHVMTKFIHWALTGQPILVHGAGSATRSFTHVSDAAKAIVKLMKAEAQILPTERTINIAAGSEPINMMALAERIRALTRSNSLIRKISYSQDYGEGYQDTISRIPDTQRLRGIFSRIGYKWAPTTDLDEIITNIVDIYKAAGFLVSTGAVEF